MTLAARYFTTGYFLFLSTVHFPSAFSFSHELARILRISYCFRVNSSEFVAKIYKCTVVNFIFITNYTNDATEKTFLLQNCYRTGVAVNAQPLTVADPMGSFGYTHHSG